MATYLSGVQDLRRECGVSGTGPSTTSAQTGELARLVGWYKQAYTEIQNRKSWRWLRSQFSLPTVASTGSYAYTSCTDTIASAVISRFKHWYPWEFYIYLTSSGVGTQSRLTYMEWDDFKRVWMVGNSSTLTGYPAYVSVDPQNNIRLGPKPDAVYTVTGDYQKSAQVLAADADVPEMPSDFHDLIRFGAQKKYAAFMGAPEVWSQAKSEASTMMRDLERNQLPLPTFGDTLA